MLADTLLHLLQGVYVISALGLALIGFNALVLSLIYVKHRGDEAPLPPQPEEWPHVLLQIPIYNERHVIERSIRAACLLDYPADKLTIQVLDDSNDETLIRAAGVVDYFRRQGINVEHVLRDDRHGYKAGALAYGLQHSEAPFVAIFDADFNPQPSFLKRTIPHFLADEALGLVQARWAHVNEEYSTLTRAQALALDSHFAIEQTARHRGGLMTNFAGTAGVWRRQCIEESGGWHCDTLSEDIDLSYRAQLAGWGFLYLPGLGVPAEIPPLMMGFKRQQARWATGTIQCLRKLGLPVLRSDLSPWQKLQAMVHLGGYVIHPLMILILLLTLPLLLMEGIQTLSLAGLGLAMFGPPVQAALAQTQLYKDWPLRLSFFPLFMLMGFGIAVNNTRAAFEGLSPKVKPFRRTPKFKMEGTQGEWMRSAYVLPIDATTWAELLLGVYAAVTAVVAALQAPALLPFMVLYAGGFFYVAGVSIAQSIEVRRAGRVRQATG